MKLLLGIALGFGLILIVVAVFLLLAIHFNWQIHLTD